MSAREHRVVELHVGGQCELACAPCDCRTRASDPAWALETAAQGGSRLTCRGGTSNSALLPKLLAQACDTFEERIVRTPAVGLGAPGAAERLAASGATGVLVPLFSHVAAVHDRIAGSSGALVRALAGMRAASAAGLTVDVELPLLHARLQDPVALVELARRAVERLRRVRFFLPRMKLPEALAPPSWDEGAERLVAAIERAEALGLRVEPAMVDALPLCAFRGRPELLRLFRARGERALGTSLVEACEGCAVADRCAGVAESYRAAHGVQGIVAYGVKPAGLGDRAPNPNAQWSPARVASARKASMLVLRPTVNCNQDCTFCSANETSGNIWTSREEMLRAIVRAGRRGVRWLSFSGGEPTLSKDLVAYVRAASRSGIENVEIITNGVLLDRLDKVHALRRAGLTHAFVSLHAHDEELSRRMTQKVGDFAKTVAAVGHLLDSFVQVTINHVITARNYRYLKRFVEFVHERWGGRAWISFAFVTPQFKALEQIELVPKLSEVRPHLRRALYRAMELRQPVTVGVRQGIPPCQLGEFQAWSDLFQRAAESAAEDAPQKLRAKACDECRYGSVCPGLWRPYAARHGTEELRAIPGAPVDLSHHVEGRQALFSFDAVPEELRDRSAEQEWLDGPGREASVVETVPLPLFQPVRSRPLRVAMLGTGPRARKLAAALGNISGLSLDAVASPHARDGDLAEFGNCPVFAALDEALESMRPEAVIVASSTATHAGLVQRALEAGVPVLAERPLTATSAEAEGFVSLEASASLVTMDPLLLATTLAGRPAAADRWTVTWRQTAGSARSPLSWGRTAIGALLLDLVGGLPAPEGDVSASFRGASRPERARLEWTSGGASVSVRLEFDAGAEGVEFTAAAPAGPFEWRSSSASFDPAPVLEHFRDVVLGRAVPVTTAREALASMRLVTVLLDALERAGVPFEREAAPTHVASRAFREGFR